MISTHEQDTVIRNIEEVLIDQVVRHLTQTEPSQAVPAATAQPEDREIVFRGSFEEVNEFFYRNQWTDGLPIVPPSIEKIEEFLKFTDRSPDEVIGVMHPS